MVWSSERTTPARDVTMYHYVVLLSTYSELGQSAVFLDFGFTGDAGLLYLKN